MALLETRLPCIDIAPWVKTVFDGATTESLVKVALGSSGAEKVTLVEALTSLNPQVPCDIRARYAPDLSSQQLKALTKKDDACLEIAVSSVTSAIATLDREIDEGSDHDALNALPLRSHYNLLAISLLGKANPLLQESLMSSITLLERVHPRRSFGKGPLYDISPVKAIYQDSEITEQLKLEIAEKIHDLLYQEKVRIQEWGFPVILAAYKQILADVLVLKHGKLSGSFVSSECAFIEKFETKTRNRDIVLFPPISVSLP